MSGIISTVGTTSKSSSASQTQHYQSSPAVSNHDSHHTGDTNQNGHLSSDLAKEQSCGGWEYAGALECIDIFDF